MHDAELHLRLRKHGFDGLREALQSVHAGDEDILHAALRLARVLGPFRRFNLAHPKLLILRRGGFGLTFI